MGISFSPWFIILILINVIFPCIYVEIASLSYACFFLSENTITSSNFRIQEVFPHLKLSFFPDLEKIFKTGQKFQSAKLYLTSRVSRVLGNDRGNNFGRGRGITPGPAGVYTMLYIVSRIHS